MGREAQTKTRFAAVAKERGVSYEKFAEAVIEVGASRRTAGRYWAGDTLPRVPELAAICRLLQVTADYFAELIDEPLGIGGVSAPASVRGAKHKPVRAIEDALSPLEAGPPQPGGAPRKDPGDERATGTDQR